MAAPKSASKADSPSSVVPVAVNFAPPELALDNINGETKSLAEYRNAVVLVNNWATWCPPCKAEMPTLSAYYDEHHADGFMIIAIEAGDAKEAVSEFAQSYNLNFQVWLDPGGAALDAFGNRNLPNSYVIDLQELSAMPGRVRSTKPCSRNTSRRCLRNDKNIVRSIITTGWAFAGVNPDASDTRKPGIAEAVLNRELHTLWNVFEAAKGV